VSSSGIISFLLISDWSIVSFLLISFPGSTALLGSSIGVFRSLISLNFLRLLILIFRPRVSFNKTCPKIAKNILNSATELLVGDLVAEMKHVF